MASNLVAKPWNLIKIGGTDFRQNFTYKKEVLIWELDIPNPREAIGFNIAQENGHEMLAMERSNPIESIRSVDVREALRASNIGEKCS